MLPQYKLVVVSFISFVIALILISIYLYFTKKKNYLWLLLLSSLPPLVSIFRQGSYESGDLSLNVYKTMALFASLKDGIIPANWAGTLNATYGYPMFNFAYPLPYYLASMFHLVGFSFLDSVKLVLAVSFILSGIAMYYFLRQYLIPFASFVGAIFYLYAPYHLVDMHFRVDIGEMTAFVFVPLLFLFSTKLLRSYTPFTLIFLAFSLAGLLLSHQAVSLMTLPFWSLYMIILLISGKYSLRDSLPICIATALGFGLASFYVLPVIWELQYTLQPSMAQIEFPTFREFFYAPWRYGFLFQGHQGELSFLIGYAQLIILIITPYFLWKNPLKKIHKIILTFAFVSFLVVFFMMQSFSEPLWHIIPLIKNFQFSYRLLSLEIFFTAIFAAFLTPYLPKKYMVLLLFIAVFSTILNWGNRRNMPELTDTYFVKNLPFSTYEGEGLTPAAPKWVDDTQPWFQSPPKKHLEILEGIGNIEQLNRSTTVHTYRASASSSLLVQENTLFFPGWEVFINGKEVPIRISDTKNQQGVMHFSVPKGTSTLEVVYSPTPIRKISIFISLASLLICTVLASIEHKKYSIGGGARIEHRK